MNKMLEKIQKSWMLSAGASMIIGLVLVLIPGFITKAAGYLMGAAAILFGLIRIIRYFGQKHIYPEFFRGDLLAGFLAAGLGLYILLNVEAVLGLVPVMAGAALIANGVVGLQRAHQAKKAGYQAWWMLLAFAGITLAAGVLLVINPFGALKTAVILIGAALIYEGASDILTMLIAGKKIEGWKASEKKTETR